jgi:Nuclease-related domain
MRKQFAIATTVCLSLVIPYNVIGIRAGGAWMWSAGAVSGAVITALMALRDSPPDYIARWELGAWGERATGRALRPLRHEGWHVLHDLQHEHGNIDHVVVGPGRRLPA